MQLVNSIVSYVALKAVNKGPYIVEAVRALDDILRRMEAHQDKKRSSLRRLHVAGAVSATSGQ